jgi:Na+-driven multidrug efflux pump
MIATVAAQWLFFLPLAWLLALRLGHGALGAWIAFAAQITLLGVAFLVVFLGKGWTSRAV